jgi:cation transport ATPase
MASAAGKPKNVKAFANKRMESLSKYAGVAMIVFIIFILGGGVYDIINQPGSMVATSSTTYSSIYPGYGDQTINESVVSMFLYASGFLGLYLVLRSTQVLYDKSKANMNLLVGVGLAIMGFAGAYVLLFLKIAS